jgi:gamma-glutamyltranspeptidase/glutathione hydrolase
VLKGEKKVGDILPKELKTKQGMVTAAHPLAAEAGLKMLKVKGGNAIDAAVATALALGVVDPANSGLGGYGGIAVIYLSKEKIIKIVDFNTKLPYKSPQLSYSLKGETPDNMVGYKAISIPGVVAGLHAMATNFGCLEWSELFEPAIDLANNGFHINQTIADTLQEPHIKLFSETMNELFNGEDKPLKAGDYLTRRNYGRSLGLIASHGPEEFYQGEIGREITDVIQKNNGALSLEDLKNYQAQILDPININYRGYDVYGAPSGTGSFTMMQTLNILEGFGLQDYSNRSARMTDLVARAMAMAWRDRFSLPVKPSQEQINNLLDKQYAYKLGQIVKSGVGPITFESDKGLGHTTHLSTADGFGNMVALTLTHGPFWYGSGVTIPKTGIIMNNGISLFNKIIPGAMALTNMTPTIVLKNEKPLLSIGTPGARRIVSMVTNFLIDIIDYNYSVSEAVANTRFHYEGGDLLIEKKLSAVVCDELRSMGYQIGFLGNGHFYGPASGIAMEHDLAEIRGGTDPRFGGGLVGY